jgi:hypothetical protein
MNMASALVAKLVGPISSQQEIFDVARGLSDLIRDGGSTPEEQADLHKRITSRHEQWEKAASNLANRLFHGACLPGLPEAARTGREDYQGSETGNPLSTPLEGSVEPEVTYHT